MNEMSKIVSVGTAQYSSLSERKTLSNFTSTRNTFRNRIFNMIDQIVNQQRQKLMIISIIKTFNTLL